MAKTNRMITSKHLARAFGFGLSLFMLSILISPFTRLWPLAAGPIWLFGLPGYWFLIPLLFIDGIFLLIRGKHFHKGLAFRLFFGLLFTFVGAIILLSVFFSSSVDFPSLNSFLSFMKQELQSQPQFVLSYQTGGGVAGFALSFWLGSLGNTIVYVGGGIFLAIGLAILFFPMLVSLLKAQSRRRKIKKVKKASQRQIEEKLKKLEAEQKQEAANEPLEKSRTSSAFRAHDLSSAKPAFSLGGTPEPTPTHLTRSELYRETTDNASQDGLPQEIPTPIVASHIVSPRQMSRSGLREAVFAFPASQPGVSASNQINVTHRHENEKTLSVDRTANSNKAPLVNEIVSSEPYKKQPDDLSEKGKLAASISSEKLSRVNTPVESQPILEQENKPVTKMESQDDDRMRQPQENVISSPEPISLDDSSENLESNEHSLPCHQPEASPRPAYLFPPLDLLKTYPESGNREAIEAECERKTALINQALNDLGAGAQVIGYTVGPSVTRYDLQTNRDVSVSSIGKYIQDISVRLGGVPTRYEEVVRGKSTSGLEIANKTTTIVSLREMIEHLPQGEDKNLYVPFGKSISGDYISADLSDFPHMLVSGATGSGKSIFLHSLIMSLIMRNRPEDLRLVVIDPKRVEMAKYKDLPHLLCPIIKEPSEAKMCLKKLIDEMERRYTLFELSGVSNIRQFNKEYAAQAGLEKLPFIVVCVDEYADLVDSCKDIGESVVRLAQKARAAGIHLVIATQRPSVQVITGIIKANLPVRVALSVASATDSMTILGEGGAEELCGHGDMLVDCFLVARNGFTRCQGCYVDNHEIKAVTDYIRSQSSVTYDPNFIDLVDHEAERKAAYTTAQSSMSKADIRAQASNDFYQEVKEDVMQQEYTSISKIQRQFGVGFPRAGKLFARLQAEGIVASAPETASSSKGCRVLVHAAAGPDNPGSTDSSSSGSGTL